MLKAIHAKLTYANVMATVAVFLALGAGAYAAFQLPKNSVKSDNIVNHQVKGADLAASGPVKSAGLVSLVPPNFCGSMSAPQNQWVQFDVHNYGPVGYSRDVQGSVHLHGWANKCGSPASGNVIFTLPNGYRPALNETQLAAGASGDQINVAPNGEVSLTTGGALPILDGIEFQCAPSGQNGCP